MIYFDARLPHGSRPNHSSSIRAAQFITYTPEVHVAAERRRSRAALVWRHIQRTAPGIAAAVRRHIQRGGRCPRDSNDSARLEWGTYPHPCSCCCTADSAAVKPDHPSKRPREALGQTRGADGDDDCGARAAAADAGGKRRRLGSSDRDGAATNGNSSRSSGSGGGGGGGGDGSGSASVQGGGGSKGSDDGASVRCDTTTRTGGAVCRLFGDVSVSLLLGATARDVV